MGVVTVIMPMAGLGSRFAAAGENRPKPTIPILGMPMFQVALGAIKLELGNLEAIGVVLAEHDDRFGISEKLVKSAPDLKVSKVPKLTGGALETCLAAEDQVSNPRAPIIILDCDLAFTSSEYFATLRELGSPTQPTIGGVLLSFRSRDPKYSFALVKDGRVLRTAEKQPVSDRALAGVYGFQSANLFFDVAREIVERNHRTANGEFYVSTAYNSLINAGLPIAIRDVNQYWSMGTPLELANCLLDQQFCAHVERVKLNNKLYEHLS